MIRGCRRPALGFTLLELLVVLVVISLSLSLVGPSVEKVYEGYQHQEDLAYLRRWVKQVSYRAVLSNRTYVIEFSRDAVSARPKKDEEIVLFDAESQELQSLTMEFKTLFFDETELRLEAYPSGVLSHREIYYRTSALTSESKRLVLEGGVVRW